MKKIGRKGMKDKEREGKEGKGRERGAKSEEENRGKECGMDKRGVVERGGKKIKKKIFWKREERK